MDGFTDIISGFWKYLIVPILAAIGWLWRKQDTEIKELKLDVAKLKIENAVMANKLDTMKEDLQEIKYSLNKLLDVLQCKR